MEKYYLTEEVDGKEMWLADFADVNAACLSRMFIYGPLLKTEGGMHVRRTDGSEVDYEEFKRIYPKTIT